MNLNEKSLCTDCIYFKRYSFLFLKKKCLLNYKLNKCNDYCLEYNIYYNDEEFDSFF